MPVNAKRLSAAALGFFVGAAVLASTLLTGCEPPQNPPPQQQK